MEDVFAKIIELKKSGINCALCTLTETKGSVPRKAGAKMIVADNNMTFGTVGGGNIELQITEKALEVMQSKMASKFYFDLEENSEMSCGGSVEVFIEPIMAKLELVIFGAGHVGMALAGIARDFGFRVVVADNREELLRSAGEKGFDILHGGFVELADSLDTSKNTFLVVSTPSHQYDEEVTAILCKKPFKYLGMIGSKRKVALASKNFREKYMLTDEQIAKIDMPIGIPFNAQTPEEIAISILAKLIHEKNS
ncbi:MAG: XdhC family protein [Bacteroidales bacterium]|nr:XdhC family protein [Bacteroidales bacterium]